MKVLYVHNLPVPSPAANSVHVMQMASAFSANGHDVVLAAPQSGHRGTEDVYTHYGVPPSFRVELPTSRHEWADLSGPRGRFLKLVRRVKTAASVILRERRRGCELVYTRCVIAAAIAACLRVDFILELHEPPANLGNGTKRLAFEVAVRSDRMRRLVLISEALKRIVLSSSDNVVPSSKILVAHDGAKVSGTLSPPSSNESVRVGYAGHLYRGRGLGLISSMASALPHLKFSVAGGLTADVEYWKDVTSDVPNIEFLGALKPSEVPAFLASMDILLAPYQREVHIAGGGGLNTVDWMSPLKVFEYMSSGKAIVASDLPVLREVLTHEETALLVPPDDLVGWTAAVSLLSEDVPLRATLGANARRLLESEFSWRIRAKKVLEGVT